MKGRVFMDINALPPELQEKVKACTCIEDLEALFAKAGFELSDEELSTLAGGIGCNSYSSCRLICGLHIPPCPGATFDS